MYRTKLITLLLFHFNPLTLSPSPLLPLHTYTEQRYSREVRIIPVDFSEGLEIYPKLANDLKDLDIGVLGMYDQFV